MTETQAPTKLPRTIGETLARLRDVLARRADPFGIEPSRLLDALPFSVAREFLTEGVTEDGWEQGPRLYTLEAVRKSGADYYPFAWGSANDRRMVSAVRTAAHYRGLAWLAGNDALVALLTNPSNGADIATAQGLTWTPPSGAVAFYGKGLLVAAAELVGLDWRTFDNGQWFLGQDTDATEHEAMTADAALATMRR